MRPNSLFLSTIYLMLCISILSCTDSHKYSDPEAVRWEEAINNFEIADKENPPPEGVIVFVGSSSITGWSELESDMAPLPVINRGFGGATMVEVNHYRDRIVTNYQPSIVVVYAGENDIASGGSANALIEQYESFLQHLKISLPDTKICFISIKPSPARISYWDEMMWANFQLERLVQADPIRLCYLDITPLMLDIYNEPKPELYQADNLHINRAGYELWGGLIKPVLSSLSISVQP